MVKMRRVHLFVTCLLVLSVLSAPVSAKTRKIHSHDSMIRAIFYSCISSLTRGNIVPLVITESNDHTRLGGDADDLAGGKKNPIGGDEEREKLKNGIFENSKGGSYELEPTE